jgi:hypothetical protein
MSTRQHLACAAITVVAFVVTAGARAPRGSVPCCTAAAATPRVETPAEHRLHVEAARASRAWHLRVANSYLRAGR